MAVRALTILNERGDQTLLWTESQDEEIMEIVKKKMAEGVRFFVIEPRFGGWLPSRLTPLEKAEDAKKHRALSIPDADIRKFAGMDGVEVVKTPPAKVRTIKQSDDPKEIAKSESVGVKPQKGG